MLAVTIFAVLGTIVLSTFRTGTRAYESAQRQSQLLDRARFVFDTIERDIHNIYFQDESAYNATMRAKINQLNQDIDRAEQSDSWDDFFARYGDPDDPRVRKKEEEKGSSTYLGNPYDYGILIDLQMVGQAGEGRSELSFATYRGSQPSRNQGQWGLDRVRYIESGGVLMRNVESVFDAPRDIFGELLEEPEPERREILAEGVREFELKFGYWFDQTWIESDRWNSNRREMRNSYYTLTEEENADTAEQLADPNSPAYHLFMSRINQAPADNLPAYIRIRLTLEDPDRPAFSEIFQTIVRVPGSSETYIANPFLSEGRRQGEIDGRRKGEWGTWE